jgi:hypothetical protein
MQSAVKKRSVVVGVRKTSTSLENEFWKVWGRVLACFDPQWPDLKLAVACFGGT